MAKGKKRDARGKRKTTDLPVRSTKAVKGGVGTSVKGLSTPLPTPTEGRDATERYNDGVSSVEKLLRELRG